MNKRTPAASSWADEATAGTGGDGPMPGGVSLRPRPDRRRRDRPLHLRLQRRLLTEYMAMPGRRITTRQAACLLALDGASSERILDECVESGWLLRTADGTYALAGPSSLARRRRR